MPHRLQPRSAKRARRKCRAFARSKHARHPPMTELLRRNFIPLIVATALFMENLDATVLATSLPAIAKDMNANPLTLSWR